jgi:glyoxylate/hydroxypyruvate reductase A
MENTLLIRVDPERRSWWKKTLETLLPEIRVVLFDEDEYIPSDITIAVVWNPPIGMFKKFSNLRCVISVGAGVSHILKDPDYPRHVPIIRTTGESLRIRMSEYVALHVLRFHRRLPEIEIAHKERKWTQFLAPVAPEVQVGIMGLGNLGAFCARTLFALRYSVVGWSRRKKEIEGVTCFFGDDQLDKFLSSTQIIVCMLPQTSKTKDILCAKTFTSMQKGSYLINVGRGECLVEEDLIAALDNGRLAGATLDVFREEPLPSRSSFWTHPKILVTCHTASAIDPAVGGQIIAENVKAFLRGDHVSDVVDIEQGY